VQDYFLGLQEAGFVVQSLRESRPERKWFEHDETYERRKTSYTPVIAIERKQQTADH
jgi:hypothetical protein